MIASRSLATLTLFCLLFTLHAEAQQAPIIKKSSQSKVDFYYSNYGIFGLNVAQNMPGFFYPRGSGKNYIFGGGLWFATKKDRFDSASGNTYRVPLCFLSYNPTSGASWSAPGDTLYVADSAYPFADAFSSAYYNKATGVHLVDTLQHWPLWALPAEQITPLHTGTFVPYNADRVASSGGYISPAFVPGVDEQIVSRYHDGATNRYDENLTPKLTAEQIDSLGYPIGLQIQETIYSWSSGPFASTVVIQYQIVNITSDTLTDCVAAILGDPDVGDAQDDQMTFYTQRPELRAAVASGGGTGYLSLASALIEAPVVDSRGVVQNSRRTEYRTNGRITSFPIWKIQNDPRTAAARYSFMTSDSITPSGGGDIRLLLPSQVFSLPPLDTATIAVAHIVLDPSVIGKAEHDDDDRVLESAPNLLLEAGVERVLQWYYSTDSASGVGRNTSNAKGEGITIAPNPATGRTEMRFALDEASTVIVRVVDHLGRTRLTHDLGRQASGTINTALDLEGLEPGHYTVAIATASGRSTASLYVTH